MKRHSEKIQWRPTLTGGLVFAIVITNLLLAVSSPSNSNFALFFTFSLCGVCLISLWLTSRNIRDLQVSIHGESISYSGQVLHFTLNIKNIASHASPSLILGQHRKAHNHFELGPNVQKTLSITLPAQQRGRYTLEDLWLSTDYPLGIFQAKLPVNVKAVAWQLVKVSKDDTAILNDKTVNHDEDIDTLREYQAGDGYKTIHWKSYAKHQKLITRHASSNNESETRITIRWKDTQGSTEQRIQTLSALIAQAEQKKLNYSLELEEQKQPHASGTSHYIRCLKLLSCYRTPEQMIASGFIRGKE